MLFDDSDFLSLFRCHIPLNSDFQVLHLILHSLVNKLFNVWFVLWIVNDALNNSLSTFSEHVVNDTCNLKIRPSQTVLVTILLADLQLC